EQLVEGFLLGGRHPQVRVLDLLREGLGRHGEGRKEVGGHDVPPALSPRGERPSMRSSRAVVGSKSTREGCGASRLSRLRGRVPFLTGSTGCKRKRLPSCSSQGGSLGSTRQRQTVTSRPPRKPRSVSQSSPSIERVLSRRTRRRTWMVSAARRRASSKSSGT